jgi:septal ring factor EnvC (AmiA/AmiB activator)
MAPRIPNPLGASSELVAALRVLPKIAENTESMARDTRALSDLKRDIALVAERTEGITTMDGRMANIEAAMPLLVDVQKDLAALPELISRLDSRIDKLAVQLDDLARSVENLQRSITPLGRLAGRLPGGKKGVDTAADSR